MATFIVMAELAEPHRSYHSHGPPARIQTPLPTASSCAQRTPSLSAFWDGMALNPFKSGHGHTLLLSVPPTADFKLHS